MFASCCRCTRWGASAGEYSDVRRGTEASVDAVVDASESAWVRKWSGFLKAMRLGRHHQDVESTAYVCSLLLRLYAHEPVLHELEALYAHRPERFIFFLPQFANFALLMMHNVGEPPSPRSGGSAEGTANDHRTLDALECFLHDKCEHSLRFAQRLFWFARSFHPEDLSSLLITGAEKRGSMACATLDWPGMARAVEAAANGTGAVFELTKPLPRFAVGPPHVLGVTPFRWAISLFDELANMGETLKDCPEARRNAMLRATLQSLSDEYLPSKTLYLPIGARASRVVGFVGSESFCFKTNTRVPFLVCLEVIDDPLPPEPEPANEKKGGLKQTLGALKNQIQRQLSSTSATGDHQQQQPRSVQMRHFSSSTSSANSMEAVGATAGVPSSSAAVAVAVDDADGDMQPMAMETDVSRSKLGQWAPRVEARRGAGFSHFVNHKDFDFEQQRSKARRLALAQHSSSFTDIDLDSTSITMVPVPGGARALYEDDDNDNDEASSRLKQHAHDQHKVVEHGHHTDDDDDEHAALHLQLRDGSTGGHDDDDEHHEGDDDDEASLSSSRMDTGIVFNERWAEKERRVASTSRYSHVPGWRLEPVIVKSGDDLRQEQLASQMIALCDRIFREDGLSLRLRPYDILALTPDAGIIQAVPDTVSIDSLKKNDPNYTTLRDFFIRYFGRPRSPAFKKATNNFCESLAAYSVVTYILQVKDRHNGNLLVDADGHILHIDFGFLLTSHGPGNLAFEAQIPFKLTQEFVQVLGGADSALFRRFRWLVSQAYLAVHKRREEFVLMLETMLSAENAGLDCFQAGAEETIKALNYRLGMGKSKGQCITFINDLVDTAMGSMRMKLYDLYQYWALSIAA